MKPSIRIAIDARLIAQTGVGRYIRNLIRELSINDTHNEYVVFVRKADAHFIELPNTRWKKIIADVPWHSIAEQFVMPFMYLAARVDIVHVPYFTAPVLYPGKFILTIHDLTILHLSTGRATTLPYWFYKLRRAGYAIILHLGIRRASKILTVSETTREDIAHHFPSSLTKIVVAYEGVDTTLAGSDTEKSLPVRSPYFLYVGNAYPHKNLELLVDAYADFIKKNTGTVKLVMAGKDDYFYTRLRTYVTSKGLSDSVVFTGHIQDTELSSLYRFALALVFPSLSEGFGLPALEALSFGCPILVSDIGVFREILPKGTVFLDPNNPDDWTRAFENIAAKRKTLQANTPDEGVRTYLKKFSWRTLARVTRTTYEDSAGLRQS